MPRKPRTPWLFCSCGNIIRFGSGRQSEGERLPHPACGREPPREPMSKREEPDWEDMTQQFFGAIQANLDRFVAEHPYDHYPTEEDRLEALELRAAIIRNREERR